VLKRLHLKVNSCCQTVNRFPSLRNFINKKVGNQKN
jgi:hypothetical protein